MIRQRTIKDPVTIEGAGLQTGKKARVTLKGSPANSGINFIRVDLPNKPLLSVASLDLTQNRTREAHFGSGRRTIVAAGPVEIQTTEHLLAALSGLSIDNITAEIDNIELPCLDGSAGEFVNAIKKAGIIEQDAPKRILKIDSPVWVEGEDNMLAAFPSENFRISYTMSYKEKALGTSFLDITLDEGMFEREIAPARTFCRQGEALVLLACGLGRGASPGNTLIMGRKGPFANRLRFPDEPVRHKVLDLIGDLYLLGAGALKAHVVAIKSGHRLNIELAGRLKALLNR